MNVPAKLNNEYRNRYLDEIAPATNAGRIIKFTKEGSFVTADDGTPSQTRTPTSRCAMKRKFPGSNLRASVKRRTA
jgi:hypothetical protein